jgi:GT2 family glycosyltransferase
MVASNEMRPPRISVIVVTRDRPTVLSRCLQHLFTEIGCTSEVEVIVVDNSSDRQSTLAVVNRFASAAHLRTSPNRRNPALMRNLGIQASHGEILAFIDDDTLVAPGWLSALVEAFADPQVGGVSGRVIETDTPEVCTPEIGRFTPRGQITMNFNNMIDRPVSVEFLYGCNMAVRRSALARVGMYDPWYGIVYEEQDLSFRIRKAGYQYLRHS